MRVIKKGLLLAIAMLALSAPGQTFYLTWDRWTAGINSGFAPQLRIQLYWSDNLVTPVDQWPVIFETADLETTSADVSVPPSTQGFFVIGYRIAP